jgi:hypothetical protein
VYHMSRHEERYWVTEFVNFLLCQVWTIIITRDYRIFHCAVTKSYSCCDMPGFLIL